MAFLRVVLIFTIIVPGILNAQEIELRRETSVTLTRCSESDQSNEFPQTQAYIRRIAARVMSNNPSIFHDDLDPSNICVSLDPVASQRAWADAGQRSFEIDAGLILRAQNENQLAFTISHEFAHVALRHGPLEGNPIPEESREEANRLFLEHESVYNCLLQAGKDPDLIGSYHRQLDIISSSIHDMFTHYYDEEVAANWMETEADVAGTHYFLNAGYSPVEVAWRFEQMVVGLVRAGVDPIHEIGGNDFDPHSAPSELSPQERAAFALRACGLEGPNPQEPPRGTNRYPMPCWQIWNLKINLPATNQNYARLFSQGSSNEKPSRANELNLVQAELCANQGIRIESYCN